MSQQTSALYPAGEPGLPPTAWFSTLRRVLERLTAAQQAPATGGAADAADAATGAGTGTGTGQEDDEVVTADDPDAEHPLAAELRALSPEAADVPSGLLADLLAEHAAAISTLTRSFDPAPAAQLVALGRGLAVGELDPVTRDAVAAGVPELAGVVESGSVAVHRDDRATTLIAAATVGAPAGPVRLTGAHWDREGLTDVWFCAVSARRDPVTTARDLIERILPQVGVLRAHLRTSQRPDTGGPDRVHVGLQAVVPDADPDLVLARLEGWRSAVGQLAPGAVDVVWEQA